MIYARNLEGCLAPDWSPLNKYLVNESSGYSKRKKTVHTLSADIAESWHFNDTRICGFRDYAMSPSIMGSAGDIRTIPNAE